MALNFPDSPTLNQVYTDATSGFSYLWNGSVWISYESSTASNIQELDDISGSFDGITDTFPLTVGSQSITPANTNQLIISVGGVMQNPTNDFYISGSNIVFTTPPTSGLTFFGTLLGTALSLNTIADGTVTGGSLRISTNAVVGAATTFTEDLVVNGNARVVGILTVGTSSIILNGNDSTVTASAFYGDGSNLTGAGIGSDTSVNTTGIITASAFYGDGSGLTGAGSTVADDTSTNATFYPLFTQTTTGTVTASNVSTTKLTFNPSTGTLDADVLSSNAGTFGSNGTGTRTVSTGSPTGGSDGDIWYKY